MPEDSGPASLVEAVRSAATGGALISPGVTVQLLEQFTRGTARAASRQPVRPLSRRELDVVRLVVWGRANAEISAELHLALSTVKAYLAGAQTKLNVRNRVEIAVWAWETGLTGA